MSAFVLARIMLEKTVEAESGKKSASGTHGTLSSFRYCKCALCKEARNGYNKC